MPISLPNHRYALIIIRAYIPNHHPHRQSEQRQQELLGRELNGWYRTLLNLCYILTTLNTSSCAKFNHSLQQGNTVMSSNAISTARPQQPPQNGFNDVQQLGQGGIGQKKGRSCYLTWLLDGGFVLRYVISPYFPGILLYFVGLGNSVNKYQFSLAASCLKGERGIFPNPSKGKLV
ncbi:unnamed protein product [Caretta caretta]